MPQRRNNANGRFSAISARERQKALIAMKQQPQVPLPKLARELSLSGQTLSRLARNGARKTTPVLQAERKSQAKIKIKQIISDANSHNGLISERGIAEQLKINRDLVRTILTELKREGINFESRSNNYHATFTPTETDLRIISELRQNPQMRLAELAKKMEKGASTIRKRITLLKRNGFLQQKRRGYKKQN